MADLVFLKWGRQPIISPKTLLSPPIHEKTVLTGCASSTSANPLMVYIPRQRNPGSGTATKVQKSHSRSRAGWQNYFWNFFLKMGAPPPHSPPELANGNYRPQTKLREGNVYTHVCQSFCSPGGLCMMSLPVWLPSPMFLLWSHTPSRVLCAGVPWTESTLDRKPLDREPPG